MAVRGVRLTGPWPRGGWRRHTPVDTRGVGGTSRQPITWPATGAGR